MTKAFEKELEALINRHAIENGSNTPDFLLAQFLMGVLAAFNNTVTNRSHWYGNRDTIVAAIESDRPALPSGALRVHDLRATELLYAFMGWLTTRDQVVAIGASEDAATVASLVREFCDKYDLPDPRPGWDRAFDEFKAEQRATA